METELEQLRAENERLKFKLDNLGQSLRMVFFEQGIRINSVRGYSDLLLGNVEAIDLSETHRTQFLDMIHRNAFNISEYHSMARDLVEANRCLDERVHPLIELVESLLNLDDIRLLTLTEEGKSTIEISLILLDRPQGVYIDDLALHIGLSRIAHKLNMLGDKSPCEIYFSNTENKFVIELSKKIQIKDAPEDNLSSQLYEIEIYDFVANSIARLFEGDFRRGLQDTNLVCVWSFPLIEMEAKNAK